MSTPANPEALPQNDQQTIKNRMENMYRWTRHVYDITRKYYLLGRDTLINRLNAKTGENICLVGCGTGRNIVKTARTYPTANFYAFDISDEMLKTAKSTIKKAKLNNKVKLAQGYAETFKPEDTFGQNTTFDKMIFSYTLSIIPDWKSSIDNAMSILDSGGEIHIVDFGDQADLPAVFRAILFKWLSMFHVYYKPEISDYLHKMAEEKKGTLIFQRLYGGYAYYAVFRKV